MKIILEKKFKDLLDIEGNDIDRLSHAINDISEECKELINDILPKILSANNKNELLDGLFELKESISHIDYHIKDASLDEMHYVK